MTDERRNGNPKHRMSKEEYLKTHLLSLDPAKRRWYIQTMQDWTQEDYQEYQRVMLWMLGEPTQEDLKSYKEMLKAKYGIEY